MEERETDDTIARGTNIQPDFHVSKDGRSLEVIVGAWPHDLLEMVDARQLFRTIRGRVAKSDMEREKMHWSQLGGEDGDTISIFISDITSPQERYSLIKMGQRIAKDMSAAIDLAALRRGLGRLGLDKGSSAVPLESYDTPKGAGKVRR